jgi:erythromycin esterase-like protein
MVTAAARWDEMPKTMAIAPPDAETYEGVFATLDRPAFLLFPRDNPTLAKHLDLPRLQRAIGVVYRPETERHSHYYFAALTRQFDALIHINRTTALHPITGDEARERTGEPAETYPTGM